MLIGIMGSMMVGNKLLEEKVQTQVVELREFMQHRGISKPLRARVRKYMETLYQQRSGFNEREILMQLPPALAQELLSSMYRPVVEEIPMFAGALRPCSHALRLPAAPSHWPVLLTPLMMHSLAGLREEALTQLCMLLKPFMAMAGDHASAAASIVEVDSMVRVHPIVRVNLIIPADLTVRHFWQGSQESSYLFI